MPIHQNQDGTWQWGKSGKKYKKKEDAIKQMKAIFANGYVEKHASYTDTLNMIKRAAQPEPFINAVAKRPSIDWTSAIPSTRQYTNSNYKNRLFLWKTLGLDDPKTRSNMFRDAYYKALYQRQSSNNPHMTRKNRKGKIFSAGIGSMDQVALDQAKKMRLVPNSWQLKDLAGRGNQNTTKRAVQGLQEKYYNKEQLGESPDKLQGLNFQNPVNMDSMYLRYNNGRKGARKLTKNKWANKIYGSNAGLSPYEVSQLVASNRKQKLFQKDFKKVAPHLYPLAYDDRSFTNSY